MREVSPATPNPTSKGHRADYISLFTYAMIGASTRVRLYALLTESASFSPIARNQEVLTQTKRRYSL
jgi:hypothetical protein